MNRVPSYRLSFLGAAFLASLAPAQGWIERVTTVESDRRLNGEAFVVAVNNAGDSLVVTSATNADGDDLPVANLYWVAPNGAAKGISDAYSLTSNRARFASDGRSVIFVSGEGTVRYTLGSENSILAARGNVDSDGDLVGQGNAVYRFVNIDFQQRILRIPFGGGAFTLRSADVQGRTPVAISGDARRVITVEQNTIHFEPYSTGWLRDFNLQNAFNIVLPARDAASVWVAQGTRLMRFEGQTATKQTVNAGSRSKLVSAVGTFALFTTSTRLDPKDRNDLPDLYLANAADGSVRLVSADETGAAGGIDFDNPEHPGCVSDDGGTVGYTTFDGKAFVRKLDGSEPRRVPMAVGYGGPSGDNLVGLRRPEAVTSQTGVVAFDVPYGPYDAGHPYGSGKRVYVRPPAGPTQTPETIDAAESVVAVDEAGSQLAFFRPGRLRVASGVRGGSVVGNFSGGIGTPLFDRDGKLWFVARPLDGTQGYAVHTYDPATKALTKIAQGNQVYGQIAVGGNRVAWIQDERLIIINLETNARTDMDAGLATRVWLTANGSVVTFDGAPGGGSRRIRLSDGVELAAVPNGEPSRDGEWVFPFSYLPSLAYRISDSRYFPLGVPGDPIGPLSPLTPFDGPQIYRGRPVQAFAPSAFLQTRLVPGGGIEVLPYVEYAAGDGQSETWVEVRVDGDPWTRVASEVWTRLDTGEGSHVVEVRARDAANRVQAVPSRTALLTDGTAPTVGPVLVETDNYLRASLEVHGATSVRMEYGKTSTFGFTSDAFQPYGNSPRYMAYLLTTQKGKYVAQFVAVDSVGNETRSEKFIFEVK